MTLSLGVELEVCFYDEDKADEFRATPRNWYEMEHDGSLSKGQTQGEVITLPLRTEDACNTEFWRPLCNELTRASGFSWEFEACGIQDSEFSHTNARAFWDEKEASGWMNANGEPILNWTKCARDYAQACA